MLGSWLRSRAGENIRASTKEVYAHKDVTGKNEAAAGGMAATKQKLTLYLSVSFSFAYITERSLAKLQRVCQILGSNKRTVPGRREIFGSRIASSLLPK